MGGEELVVGNDDVNIIFYGLDGMWDAMAMVNNIVINK